MDLCESSNFEFLNGELRPDKRCNFTFINKLFSCESLYALTSEGIINKILDFKNGIEIISKYMPLLLGLEYIIEYTNNNKNITLKAQLKNK
jgi:hypothetical protein